MDGFPTEIYDKVTGFIWDSVAVDDKYILKSTELPELSPEARKYLKILRLVNRQFCKSASACLFRIVSTSGGHNCGPVRLNHVSNSLKRLLSLSRSPYASSVRKVIIDIEGYSYLDYPHQESYIQHLGIILPACLQNFQNVLALEFSGPQTDANVSENSRALLQKLIHCILQLGFTPALDELAIELPLAHDFQAISTGILGSACIGDCPTEHALGRLRHLSIAICDNSGSGGQRYATIKPTEGQQRYPNSCYARGFFHFIDMASELTTLQVRCTHQLDLHVLDFKRQHSLRVLSLQGVKVCAKDLISIVKQNAKSLCSLGLKNVDLKAGTWKEVLMAFCMLPFLTQFHMVSCGYDKEGESAAYAVQLTGHVEVPGEIETNRSLDFFSLGNIQRQVNKNRAACGKLKMTGKDYRSMKLPSVEDIEVQLARSR